jgi:hypothetical protein
VIEIVVGDVHARSDALRALLGELGVIDSTGRRRKGFWVVQVGDLLDRRATPEANMRTARVAVSALDVVLAGNHEVEMLTERGSPHGAALAMLGTRGWPHAAAELGGWLVTHAGIHPDLAHGLPRGAEDCVAEINDHWHRRSPADIAHPLFDWVGPRRGGISPYGGLFWSANDEWPPHRHTPWGQICGHVPQARPRLLPGPRWMIDLGASGPRLAALARHESAKRWTPVTSRASATASRRPRLSTPS